MLSMESIIGVIVTHNRLSTLKHTLQKSKNAGFNKLVIINNASNDGTKEYLETINHSELHCVHLEKNEGGAGGFYRGIEEALKFSSSGWICLFDDDSYPETDRATVEINLAKYSKKTALVAAAVYLPDSSIAEMNRVARNPFKSLKLFFRACWKGREGFHISNEDYSGGTIPIDTCSFVGCFVNIEPLISSKIRPRADFFIYGDDILFSYEFTELGFENYFCPNIKFVHDCYAYDKDIIYKDLWKVYYLHRNGLVVYSKISKWFFPVVFLKCLFQWLLRARKYKERKWAYLFMIILGLKDFIFNSFERPHSEILEIASKGYK